MALICFHPCNIVKTSISLSFPLFSHCPLFFRISVFRIKRQTIWCCCHPEENHLPLPFPLLHNTSVGAKCCVRSCSRPGSACRDPASAALLLRRQRCRLPGQSACTRRSRAFTISNLCLHHLWARGSYQETPVRLHCQLL